MKITFYSNFLNHHQLPFCQAMVSYLGDNFKFVATSPIPTERLSMGYSDMNKQYEFVITTYDSNDGEEKAMQLCLASDVIILGSAPPIYVQERMKRNLLTFRYSERPYKKGKWRAFLPRAYASAIYHHTRYNHKKLYMLCASAYTASDFALVGAYKGKTYKWGYFPQVKKYDLDKLMEQKNPGKIVILWVGRLIRLKHPEAAMLVAERLKKDGYEFHLNIIGNGDLESELKQMISDKKLADYVNLLGAMTPEQVREHMEAANVFLFTSDFNEGWGAVLNESMNSGCAVVASHAIGSVPFLIKNGYNGVIYENNSYESLYMQVRNLFDNPELMRYLGCNAYKTLHNLWNAEIAAKRFIDMSKAFLNNESVFYIDGPCSTANRINFNKVHKLRNINEKKYKS